MKRLIVFLLFCLFASSPLFSYTCFPCSRTSIAGWWGSLEYLLYWSKKRDFPLLLISNNITQTDPMTVFGDEALNDSPKSGLRVDFGLWVTPCLGVGLGCFTVGTESIDCVVSTDPLGNPVLARPFFNVFTMTPSQQLLSFPASMSAIVDINSTNHYREFIEIYGRYRYFCTCRFKLDAIGGFMYTAIDDELDISTRSDSFLIGSVTEVNDHFETSNNYYAGLVGFITELRTQCWELSAIGKVGLGNMIQEVEIRGATAVRLEDGTASFFRGGLLALPTNSGKHSAHQFEVFASINANVRLQVCKHLWVTSGYNLLYWPAVAFAGEQVDLNVNPTQIQGGTLMGPPAPLFSLKNKSFHVQGLSVGVYLSY